MKVLLIGDSCTDVYVYGDVKRLNPEAPVPVLEPKREHTSQGMAWNVYNNMLAFGLDVYMITQMETIKKTRYIDEKSNQQILRVDEEPEVKPIEYEPPFLERAANEPKSDDWYDVLVISDYDKGFITQDEIFRLVKWFDGPVIIDSKKKVLPEGAWIKINELESKTLERDLTSSVIVTKGGEGAEYNHKFFPAEKVKVRDVVGAGDTFLAALTYGYLTKHTMEAAIPIANKAAAIAVSHPGTYVLTKEDVKQLHTY
tara:strand:+ start:401 stop:1168 length:768 start_codon:yes stop_codon:yes gene_type:complete